tara:strand:+ start:1700 stop:3724 length:2025 start_codon:yes stop_codon:yes gene_type:complete
VKTITSFPYEVREIENVFIPTRDGTRLAARIWLPVAAEQDPLPAILEYIPYRKRDLSRGRDDNNHAYMAGHGYVCVRVDMRGSGDSDGVLVDEYAPTEQQDAVDVIAWLAGQSWCNGKVGMMGISWGGFNSLQVAAQRPPALKAIISACSSDDLYSDNMHYMGGCLLGDNLSEATVMFAFNSLPPDPRIVGDRWREMWKERLEGSGLWLEKWLRHQRRSDYWKKSSICENYQAIQCPVYAIGGWADGFTNAVFRLMEHLEVPRKGLIGPWGHKYPHHGIPGPDIGFLQEALRWWDYWLKDKETGIMDEPMLRAWMQDSISPNASYEERPGRWVAEDDWPPSDIRLERFPLGRYYIVTDEKEKLDHHALTLQSPLSVGMHAGKWCSYAATPDLPGDQREEDGGALVFETRPLAETVELLGSTRLELNVMSDKPLGMIAARLSDVAEDGQVTRVSYGLLNLAHRNSDEHPEPMEPGRSYKVCLHLNGIAQQFPAGHRIRISLSTTYWPLAWAPPEPFTLTVMTGDSSVILPIRTPKDRDDHLTPFDEPEQAPDLPIKLLEPSVHNWRMIRDLASNESTLEVINDQGRFRIEETGTEIARKTLEWYSSQGHDFTSLRGETYTERGFRRDDWDVEVITRTVLTSTETDFHVHAQLDAFESDERIYSQNWTYAIPRDHV